MTLRHGREYRQIVVVELRGLSRLWLPPPTPPAQYSAQKVSNPPFVFSLRGPALSPMKTNILNIAHLLQPALQQPGILDSGGTWDCPRFPSSCRLHCNQLNKLLRYVNPRERNSSFRPHAAGHMITTHFDVSILSVTGHKDNVSDTSVAVTGADLTTFQTWGGAYHVPETNNSPLARNLLLARSSGRQV